MPPFPKGRRLLTKVNHNLCAHYLIAGKMSKRNMQIFSPTKANQNTLGDLGKKLSTAKISNLPQSSIQSCSVCGCSSKPGKNMFESLPSLPNNEIIAHWISILWIVLLGTAPPTFSLSANLVSLQQHFQQAADQCNVLFGTFKVFCCQC